MQACQETHKILKVNIKMSHKSNSDFKGDGNKSVEQYEKCQLPKNPVDIENHATTEQNDSKTTESISHDENKDLKEIMENIERNSKDSSKEAVVCEEETIKDSTFEFDIIVVIVTECTVEWISTFDFIESVIDAKNTIQNIEFHDIIINEEICVNFFSLLFFTFNGEIFKCHACEETFVPLLFDEHCNTSKHNEAMEDTPVLIQYDSEFIREIRPGCFHCGFCNEIESTLEKIEAHLNSLGHRECKGYASWRLQQYQPEINKNEYDTAFSEAIIKDLLQNV